jgi:endo-1,4-beta-xylanase
VLYGGAALQRRLQADPEYAAHFANQCGVLVPEGELKWNVLRPTPDSFNFAPADWLYEFTRSHNMKFRGHTLVWFQALPAWFNSYVNAGNAKKLLEDHITRVVGHYAGKMHSWDVVNEVINPSDKRSDGLQVKLWLELAGPEYIDLAFESARAADKNALLVWNENHLEINDKWSIAKRAALLPLLKEKLRRKIPIDAVGLQSHLSTSHPSFNSEEFRNFVKAIADLGLKIIISELDVIDHDAPSSFASRDQMVAETYSSFLNSMLKQPSVIAVLTWGLSDKYSWLAKFKPREDRLPVRPLPFDESLAGKPAWTAMANAFDAAPVRH